MPNGFGGETPKEKAKADPVVCSASAAAYRLHVLCRRPDARTELRGKFRILSLLAGFHRQLQETTIS
ncbi:MAG: hypothetical protein ACLPM3_08760, partial [Terracidiphilus sp.]